MQHPDFLTVAANITRSHAERTRTETHWGPADAPIYRGKQMAACGSYVELTRFSADPTCPACRQEQAIYESLEF
jgi:hypothetical protein